MTVMSRTPVLPMNADPSAHLDPADLAGFVDGLLPAADRARIESHVADCDECRAEIVAVARLVAKPARRRVWYIPAAAVAAAAALMLVMLRPAPDDRRAPVTREPMISATVAPSALAPRGVTSAAKTLVWTSVPHADVYRITLFDDAGRSLWETQTADTVAAIPATIPLLAHASYFWKVEAQTGWNRWVASDLIEFSIGPTNR
jgi:anti-sigma factor RsiW